MPDTLVLDKPKRPVVRAARSRRDRASDSLAHRLVTDMPIGIAVMDAKARLLFWNGHAGRLFNLPSLMVEERPDFAQVLASGLALTADQRNGAAQFAALHIANGDRTESDGLLRLTPARGRRLEIQIQGLGRNRWMIMLDDGRGNLPSRPAARDAWVDALTGLANRRHFHDALRERVEGGPSDNKHAVLFIDLDQFGAVNDAMGHAVGDALLCLVAQRLKRESRGDDLLVRLGGDEFAILMTNAGSAEALASRILNGLATPFSVEGRVVRIGASIGIAHAAQTADELMHRAEAALRIAKAAGGGAWHLIDGGLTVEIPHPASLPPARHHYPAELLELPAGE